MSPRRRRSARRPASADSPAARGGGPPLFRPRAVPQGGPPEHAPAEQEYGRGQPACDGNPDDIAGHVSDSLTELPARPPHGEPPSGNGLPLHLQRIVQDVLAPT